MIHHTSRFDRPGLPSGPAVAPGRHAAELAVATVRRTLHSTEPGHPAAPALVPPRYAVLWPEVDDVVEELRKLRELLERMPSEP